MLVLRLSPVMSVVALVATGASGIFAGAALYITRGIAPGVSASTRSR